MSIFDVGEFQFPYHYKFPGQASNERILFVTRENKVMLFLRLAGVVLSSLFIFIAGVVFAQFLQELSREGAVLIEVVAALVAVVATVLGYWWTSILWRKSLMIVTTQRLTKFIYTTPFNRHNLTLPLDMIVDTGSYNKGFWQAVFKLGTFTARSSAASSGVATDDDRGRVNKKYFYIENVIVAEDLQHYINKLLQAFRQYHQHLATFRPFLPSLKGEARKKFMADYPEYWS